MAINITSAEEAKEAVKAISNWLKGRDGIQLTEDERKQPPGSVFYPDEARMVRSWCRDILEASQVDDMGGCPLCQG